MPYKALDGKAFKNIFIAGSVRLDQSREYLNSINVFPVPDGDTGSNMAATLNKAVEALASLDDHSLPIVLDVLSKKLRMEARGNSGIILSEFFYGMFLRLKEGEVVEPAGFIQAMSSGKEAAYSALAEPKEGTILTLISKSVDSLRRERDDIEDMRLALEKLVERCRKALDETKDEMPLLHDNDVVDSGAHGFLLFWEGALGYLRGEFQAKILKPIKKVFTSDKSESIKYRYCAEGLVRGVSFNRRELMTAFEKKGDSLIVTGDGELLKVHLHTNDLGFFFDYLATLGEVVKTKKDDMRRQSKEKASARIKQRVGIVVDSTCDLDLDIRDGLGVEMIPLQVIFGEESFRDRIDITADEFYLRLKRTGELPKTSQPNASDFLRGYEEISTECEEILAVYISSTLSGTWQAGRKWGDQLDKGKVMAYDSGQASLAMGLMVMEAARMARDGAGMDEIVGRLDSIKSRVSTYFTVDTLEFLAKNGRIGAAKKILGTAMGLKPI